MEERAVALRGEWRFCMLFSRATYTEMCVGKPWQAAGQIISLSLNANDFLNDLSNQRL